jgi:hypothetical protein
VYVLGCAAQVAVHVLRLNRLPVGTRARFQWRPEPDREALWLEWGRLAGFLAMMIACNGIADGLTAWMALLAGSVLGIAVLELLLTRWHNRRALVL